MKITQWIKKMQKKKEKKRKNPTDNIINLNRQTIPQT